MKKHIKQILLAVIVMTFNSSTHASDEIIHTYRSLRAYSMGATFVTTGDYADALFGNPARHTEPIDSRFSIIDFTLESNPELISNINNIKNIKGSGAAVVSSIAPLVGKNLHARNSILIAGYNPEFISDRMAFAGGFLLNTQLNAFPHFDTNVDTQTYLDIGPHFGFAHRFLEDDALSIGVNLHTVYRVAIDRRILALDLISSGDSLTLKSVGTEGLGIDADLGANYKIPLELSWVRLSSALVLSSLAMSHYSLYNAKIVAKQSGLHPPRNNRTVSMGLRSDFPDFWIFKNSLFAIEFTDLGSVQYRSSLAKKFHFGGETQFFKWLLFRAGVNQGYATAGIGFALPVLKIDIATWGEELGTNAGQYEDRRFGLRLAAEI